MTWITILLLVICVSQFCIIIFMQSRHRDLMQLFLNTNNIMQNVCNALSKTFETTGEHLTTLRETLTPFIGTSSRKES